jgi:hypothetical protein
MVSPYDDPCYAVNGEGVEYREFSCQVPSLAPYYMEYVFISRMETYYRLLYIVY